MRESGHDDQDDLLEKEDEKESRTGQRLRDRVINRHLAFLLHHLHLLVHLRQQVQEAGGEEDPAGEARQQAEGERDKALFLGRRRHRRALAEKAKHLEIEGEWNEVRWEWGMGDKCRQLP